MKFVISIKSYFRKTNKKKIWPHNPGLPYFKEIFAVEKNFLQIFSFKNKKNRMAEALYS